MPTWPYPPGEGDTEPLRPDPPPPGAAREQVQAPPSEAPHAAAYGQPQAAYQAYPGWAPPPGYMPYMQPAYPMAMQRPGNGQAIASLVLGITSILFCWWGIVTLAQVVLAIVFGVRGMRRANRFGAPYRSLAIAGLICGCVGGLIYLSLGVLSAGIYFLI